MAKDKGKGLIQMRVIGIAAALDFLNPSMILPGPRKRALLTAATGAQRVAKKGAPGRTARSIEKQVKPHLARVYSTMPGGKMNTLEVGRSAGAKPPPVAPLLDWMRGKGFQIPAFMLSQSIGRRGFRGLFFMRAARQWVRGAMPRIASKMASDIESEAERRALAKAGR